MPPRYKSGPKKGRFRSGRASCKRQVKAVRRRAKTAARRKTTHRKTTRRKPTAGKAPRKIAKRSSKKRESALMSDAAYKRAHPSHPYGQDVPDAEERRKGGRRRKKRRSAAQMRASRQNLRKARSCRKARSKVRKCAARRAVRSRNRRRKNPIALETPRRRRRHGRRRRGQTAAQRRASLRNLRKARSARRRSGSHRRTAARRRSGSHRRRNPLPNPLTGPMDFIVGVLGVGLGYVAATWADRLVATHALTQDSSGNFSDTPAVGQIYDAEAPSLPIWQNPMRLVAVAGAAIAPLAISAAIGSPEVKTFLQLMGFGAVGYGAGKTINDGIVAAAGTTPPSIIAQIYAPEEAANVRLVTATSTQPPAIAPNSAFAGVPHRLNSTLGRPAARLGMGQTLSIDPRYYYNLAQTLLAAPNASANSRRLANTYLWLIGSKMLTGQVPGSVSGTARALAQNALMQFKAKASSAGVWPVPALPQAVFNLQMIYAALVSYMKTSGVGAPRGVGAGGQLQPPTTQQSGTNSYFGVNVPPATGGSTPPGATAAGGALPSSSSPVQPCPNGGGSTILHDPLLGGNPNSLMTDAMSDALPPGFNPFMAGQTETMPTGDSDCTPGCPMSVPSQPTASMQPTTAPSTPTVTVPVITPQPPTSLPIPTTTPAAPPATTPATTPATPAAPPATTTSTTPATHRQGHTPVLTATPAAPSAPPATASSSTPTQFFSTPR